MYCNLLLLNVHITSNNLTMTYIDFAAYCIETMRMGTGVLGMIKFCKIFAAYEITPLKGHAQYKTRLLRAKFLSKNKRLFKH